MKDKKKKSYVSLGIAYLIYIFIMFIAKLLGNVGIGSCLRPVIGFVVTMIVINNGN